MRRRYVHTDGLSRRLSRVKDLADFRYLTKTYLSRELKVDVDHHLVALARGAGRGGPGSSLGTIAIVDSATLRAIMPALPFGERDSPVQGRCETP
jgi:hypothetical protein